MKSLHSKSLSILLAIIVTTMYLNSCNDAARAKSKKAQDWFNSGSWLNGLQLKPHESINVSEFAKQYHKNPIWWDEAFKFLKTQELDRLAPGNYVIDSNNVIAMVSKVSPKDKDSTKWEAHRNFNDLQYIIRGKAKMGVTSISEPGAKVTVPYSSADNENFTVNGGRYYDAEPGTFFIFSPKEIHRPAFKVDGYDSIKKIVIKVRVP